MLPATPVPRLHFQLPAASQQCWGFSSERRTKIFVCVCVCSAQWAPFSSLWKKPVRWGKDDKGYKIKHQIVLLHLLVLAGVELIWCGAVFWVCAEHRVDTEMYLLLLSRIAQSQHLFCFSCSQAGEGLGIPGSVWGDTARTGDQKDILDLMASCSGYKVGGRRGRGEIKLLWPFFLLGRKKGKDFQQK